RRRYVRGHPPSAVPQWVGPCRRPSDSAGREPRSQVQPIRCYLEALDVERIAGAFRLRTIPLPAQMLYPAQTATDCTNSLSAQTEPRTLLPVREGAAPRG